MSLMRCLFHLLKSKHGIYTGFKRCELVGPWVFLNIPGAFIINNLKHLRLPQIILLAVSSGYYKLWK
jgi:hypothetical protein